ncbi:hypothetical protein GG496_001108 [Candidatus Fervidibacteria bacterium JGI MDM2 JNZ-1-D12]
MRNANAAVIVVAAKKAVIVAKKTVSVQIAMKTKGSLTGARYHPRPSLSPKCEKSSPMEVGKMRQILIAAMIAFLPLSATGQ